MSTNYGTLHRLAIVITVAWYSAASSGAVLIAFDLLLKPTKTVVDDFPCAAHSCACRTAAACSETCCCAPDSEPAPDSAERSLPNRMVPVTAIATSECRGGATDAAYLQFGFVPIHVFPTFIAHAVFASTAAWPERPDCRPQSRSIDAPAKIPIGVS
jgi:hypothetical protein